jgi:hypothetical protein
MTGFGTVSLPLTQHSLFTGYECTDIASRVLGLREHWIARSGNGFYSLATASYLDGPRYHANYRDRARQTNPPLLAHFGDVYARVAAFFEDLLFAPVTITNELAVPGFHVFEYGQCGPDGDNAAGRAHFDLQWMQALPGTLPDSTLSFTVAIKQPPAGAALEVWPLQYGNTGTLTGPVAEWAASHPSRRLDYTEGGITVHDGNILHAIGARRAGEPAGRRLTLQGHGVLLNGAWILYW